MAKRLATATCCVCCGSDRAVPSRSPLSQRKPAAFAPGGTCRSNRKWPSSWAIVKRVRRGPLAVLARTAPKLRHVLPRKLQAQPRRRSRGVAPTLFSISSGIQGHTETGSIWSDSPLLFHDTKSTRVSESRRCTSSTCHCPFEYACVYYARFLRISAANIGQILDQQYRTVSWLVSMLRSFRRPSTFRSEVGNRTYIIKARRMIAGDGLK